MRQLRLRHFAALTVAGAMLLPVVGMTTGLDLALAIGAAVVVALVGAIGLAVMRDVRVQTAATIHRVDAATTRIDEHVLTLTDITKREVRQSTGRLERALDIQTQQLQALQGLYHLVDPPGPIPPIRHFAASPDLLFDLAQRVIYGGARSILECGSGVSTLVLAASLRRVERIANGSDVQTAARSTADGRPGDNPRSRVVALEHEASFAHATRQMIADHGLQDYAEVIHAPLKPVTLDGQAWPWYDTDLLPQAMFDLILVDGPPSDTRTQARYPAGPLLIDRLAPNGVILLDDTTRDDERQILRRWLAEIPHLRATTLDHRRQTTQITRLPGDDR